MPGLEVRVLTFTIWELGASLLVLSAVFAVASLIRRQVGLFQDLFLPTSVIGGFLALIVAPQVMGKVTGGTSFVSPEVAAIWATFPSVLINVVFASLLLGKTLPSIRGVWEASSAHVIFGFLLSFGQYALGALLALTILVPVFGLAPESTALLEISFTGGHGTAAGLAGVWEDVGVPYGTDLGLGLATVGLVAGIVVGSLMVRRAVKSATMKIAREEPITRAGDDRQPGRLAEYDHQEATVDDSERGLAPLTSTVMFIGLSIGLGELILQALRAIERLLTGESKLMDLMPLFPMTIIGGMLVQFGAVKTGLDQRISRRRVNEVSGAALDVLILTAVGTMSLAALTANLGALVLMAVVAILWSVGAVIFLAPRMFRSRWFENALGDFGQSQGTIATGFLLIDMADPKHVTGATESFGYKQLLFEPFVGGGFITAMSVPIIHAFGLGAMLVLSILATIAMFAIGFRLARKPTAGDAQAETQPSPSPAA